MTLLLRGVISSQPLTSVPIGLHGFSLALAELYRLAPGVPWYGLLLFALLYVAFVLVTLLLHRLGRRILTNQQIALFVGAVFLVCVAEHVYWVSYVRVAALLGAASFLSYAFDDKEAGPRHTRRIVAYVLVFLAGLCLAPTGALLGLLVALPAALRVPSRNGLSISNLVTSVVPFVLAGVGFMSITVLTRTEQEAGFHQLFGRINDYRLHKRYTFHQTPDSAAHSRMLVVKDALRSGFYSDRNVISEAYFARAGATQTGLAIGKSLGAKTLSVGKALVKGYGVVLIVNLVVVAYCVRKLQSRTRRRLLLLTQVWTLGILLTIGVLWRLHPYLLASTLSVLTIGNLLFYLRHRRMQLPKVPVWGWALCIAVLGGQLVWIATRSAALGRRQEANEAFVLSLDQRFKGQTLIADGLETNLVALSPFTTYDLGRRRLLMLTGWPCLLPEFNGYLQTLTGHSKLVPALLTLAARPNTVWVAPIGFDQRLNRLLRVVHGTTLRLVRFEPFVPGPAYDAVNMYMVAIPPGRTRPLGPLLGRLLPAADSVSAGARPGRSQ